MNLRSGKIIRNLKDMSGVETNGDEVAQSTVQEKGDENVALPAPIATVAPLASEMAYIRQYLQQLTTDTAKLKADNDNLKTELKSNNANLHSKLDTVTANLKTSYSELKADNVKLNADLKTEHANLKIELKLKFDNFNLKLETINSDLNSKLDITNQKINAMEACGLILDTKINIVETEINKKIETQVDKIREDVDQVLKTKIDNIETKILDNDKQYTANLNVLAEKVNTETHQIREQISKIQGSNVQHVYTSVPQVESKVQFYGDKSVHPKIFIKNLQESVEILYEGSNIKSIIRNSLKKDAEIWYAIIEDKYETFEEFAVLFLSNFWGENEQSKVRENLFNGKYNNNKGCSREKYILLKYNYVRHLEPRMPDMEIVKYLSRHFSDDIRDVILIQGMDTIEKMLQYLRRIDDVRMVGPTTDRQGDFKYTKRYENNGSDRNQQNYQQERRTNYNRGYDRNGRDEEKYYPSYRRNEYQYNTKYRRNENQENNNQQRRDNYENMQEKEDQEKTNGLNFKRHPQLHHYHCSEKQEEEEQENNVEKQLKSRERRNTEWDRIDEISTAMIEPVPKNKNF